jgi:gluconate 2-dehydrogenase gamma chain
MDERNDNLLEKKSSRRTFLKNSGLTLGGLIVGGSLGNLFTKRSTVEVPVDHGGDTSGGTTTNTVDFTESLMFFRRNSEFNAISAAMEQIYPADEHGPGAIELRAPYFLDKQLAGPWGTNANDYRRGPFMPGESPLTNADMFLFAAKKLNSVASENYDAADFNALSDEQQVEVLTQIEAGELDMAPLVGPQFFSLLRTVTLQGCFCDPMYGGNKNMEGWKMKEFPGAQPGYAQYVETEEFVSIAPISVGGHKH